MPLHSRIVRFMAVSAWDLLVPDVVARPLSLAKNFYECFLVADPRNQLELLREVRDLSPDEIEEVVDALAAGWKSALPDESLTEPQRDLLRRLVGSLKTTSQIGGDASRSDVLREALNRSLLARYEQHIDHIQLRPEQQAVGRSMVLSALTDGPKVGGPRGLPDGAPWIPGHQLVNVLANGGFSTVYLASHFETGELRAVKVGPLHDRKTFDREVRLLAKLEGPYVVRYYDHGELSDRFWIAMEYLGNVTLTDLIRTSPSAEDSLLLVAQVLRGLERLHDAGVAHRDLKPDNVMAVPGFALKMIDFGLSKPLPGVHASHTNTMTVGLIGTARYMSPEVILASGNHSFASDLWAFGCILFELLTGQPPFKSDIPLAARNETFP